VQLIVTGEWAMPVREAEATNALIDAGCDVIATRVDSPRSVVSVGGAWGQDHWTRYVAMQAWRQKASSLAPK